MSNHVSRPMWGVPLLGRVTQAHRVPPGGGQQPRHVREASVPDSRFEVSAAQLKLSKKSARERGESRSLFFCWLSGFFKSLSSHYSFFSFLWQRKLTPQLFRRMLDQSSESRMGWDLVESVGSVTSVEGTGPFLDGGKSVPVNFSDLC